MIIIASFNFFNFQVWGRKYWDTFLFIVSKERSMKLHTIIITYVELSSSS